MQKLLKIGFFYKRKLKNKKLIKIIKILNK
jgi:hypothetical protein